jgi:glycosyltransferase involved in cell wall biosynthesis
VKVTHVVTAGHRRGAELAAAHLVAALDGHGFDQRLLALWAGDERAGTVAVDRVLVPGRQRQGRWALPLAVLALRRDLAAEPADVVLAHGALGALAAALATVGRGGPPFVWQRILQLPEWPGWHPHRLWLQLVASRATGVVALTGWTADEVRRLRFRGPVWLVPNHRPLAEFGSIDRPEAARWLREHLGVPHEAPLVGFVGHLVLQKQPHLAVEVLARVRHDVADARLVVVGDGPRRAQLEALVTAEGLEGVVHLLGHRDDVPRVLAALDLLLLPSRSESMPGVVVEAQQAGCPVVAFPVDGITDIVVPGVTGVVTDRSDPEDAANVVADLLRDAPKRQSMSDAAREHGARLSTEEAAARYVAVLRAVSPVGYPAAVRVVHVLPDLGVGGAEQSLAVLARHLPQDDAVQAVVVVRGARRPLPETVHDELQRLGVPVCDLDVPARPTRSPWGLALATARLARVARRWRADVVDAALLDASLPARLAPGPWRRVTHLVNTPWDAIVRPSSGGTWRPRVLRRVDRWTARRDHALVALTEPVADAARRDLGLEASDGRLVVVPRGVDLRRFEPRAPGPAGTLEVVSVGRLVRQKAHDVLLRAVAELRAQDVPLRLRIAGEGPELTSLQAIVDELDLHGHVELLGPVQDVPALLATADAFALASRWEGQSNAVLEAMAAGLPVVVSDLAVLREVVGDAGVRVPVGDARAWAEALAPLAADPARRARLGAAARARVEARYDASARATDLLAVYRRLLATPRVRA